MEQMTVLFIHTPWRAQSHQWVLNENGLVIYHDEEITPQSVVERFPRDYPMFKIIRAEVCQRIDTPDAVKPYSWVELERFI